MNSKSKITQSIRLFQTAPHGCSYLQDQQATTLFVDPEIEISPVLNTQLTDLGFRRSGAHVYKPDCVNCQACISCRIPVDHFQFKRRHNKLLNRNQNLRIQEVESLHTEEDFTLYREYINNRHADGDMYPANEDQYASFIAVKAEGTRFFKFYDQRQLVAVSVIDQLLHGLSAVYTFFDPHQSRRSLGNYVILWQIKKARQMGLPYLYLGYWVKECRKMNYKSAYRPLEILLNGKWLRVN